MGVKHLAYESISRMVHTLCGVTNYKAAVVTEEAEVTCKRCRKVVLARVSGFADPGLAQSAGQKRRTLKDAWALLDNPSLLEDR